MRFHNIVSFAWQLWQEEAHDTPMCLLGPPGIGKTSISASLKEKMTASRKASHHDAPPALCKVLDFSSMLPEDLIGLPFRDGDVTRYCPQEWLAALCEPGAYGVLVLDDLPAASPALQVAARQLVLERRVHEHRLAKDILIIVTGNRREDKSAASTLPAHFRNSVMLLDVEIDLDEWCVWYGEQKNQNPVIPAFLRFRPTHLSRLPKDADARGAFATPRTWAKLGRAFKTAERNGVLLDVAAGLVGEGVATEFLAFVNVRNTIANPVDVLMDPQRAIPDPEQALKTPDRLYAMATAIGETAASWRNSPDAERKKDAPLLFLRALGWMTSGNREYIAVAVSTFTSNGGEIVAIAKAATHAQDDKLAQSVIQFLASAYNNTKS